MLKKAVVLIIRNENPYVEEWVKHYVDKGLDEVMIFDNMSDTPVSTVIDSMDSKYADKCRVALEPLNEDKSPQLLAYEKALTEYKKRGFDWVAFFDADEFLHIKSDKCLDEILYLPQQVGVVSVQWELYNANGHSAYEDKPVKERFTTVSPFGRRLTKMIVRPHAVNKVYIHRADVIPPYVITQIPDLQLNHYITKSYEEWVQKIERGSCNKYDVSDYDTFFSHNPDLLHLKDENYLGAQQSYAGKPATKRVDRADFITDVSGNVPYMLHGIGCSFAGYKYFVDMLLQNPVQVDTKLFTVITAFNNYDTALLAHQLDKNNIPYINTCEQGAPWRNIDKLQYFYKTLEVVKTPYVIISDADDVLLQRPIDDEFLEKFLSLNKPIVFNAGNPNESQIEYHDKLNAGLAVAETRFAKEFYHNALKLSNLKSNIYGREQPVVIETAKSIGPQMVGIDEEHLLFAGLFNTRIRHIRDEYILTDCNLTDNSKCVVFGDTPCGRAVLKRLKDAGVKTMVYDPTKPSHSGYSFRIKDICFVCIDTAEDIERELVTVVNSTVARMFIVKSDISKEICDRVGDVLGEHVIWDAGVDRTYDEYKKLIWEWSKERKLDTPHFRRHLIDKRERRWKRFDYYKHKSAPSVRITGGSTGDNCSYKYSGIAKILSHIGCTIWHNIPHVNLWGFDIHYKYGGHSDLTIITHPHALSELPVTEPFIYEDGNAYDSINSELHKYPNCVLNTSKSYAPFKDNFPKEKMFELPFIYEPKYEMPIQTGGFEFDIAYFSNANREHEYRRDILRQFIGTDYKIFLNGIGWHDYEMTDNIVYRPYHNYFLNEVPAKISIVDIKLDFYKYDYMPPRICECLYQGFIPLLPDIPKVRELMAFDSELADALIYADHYDLLPKIKNLVKYSEMVIFEIVTKMRTRVNDVWGIETKSKEFLAKFEIDLNSPTVLNRK